MLPRQDHFNIELIVNFPVAPYKLRWAIRRADNTHVPSMAEAIHNGVSWFPTCVHRPRDSVESHL